MSRKYISFISTRELQGYKYTFSSKGYCITKLTIPVGTVIVERNCSAETKKSNIFYREIRTERAMIVDMALFDNPDETIDTSKSCYDLSEYKLGELKISDDFDPNLDESHTSGIYIYWNIEDVVESIRGNLGSIQSKKYKFDKILKFMKKRFG